MKRIYRIDPHGLAAIRAWLDEFCTASLDAFAEQISKTEENSR